MKVGIMSDTHDHLGNLTTALEILRSEGVMTVLHCGDVCLPGTVQLLAGFDVWVAQGNMDRHAGMAQVVEETFGVGRLAWLHRPLLDGYAAALLHGDSGEMLDNLIASGQYKYVFYGHTHWRRDQTINGVRVINPGALGGMRKQSYSFCILDLTTGEARFIEVGG